MFSHANQPHVIAALQAKTSCYPLLYNAFWTVNHFCVHQMLMKDRMHAIYLGVIVTLIKAMMRKFYECVEIFLDKEGLAASKLEKRFKNILATRTGPDNQR